MSVQELPAGLTIPKVRLGEGLAGKAIAAVLALSVFVLLSLAYAKMAWSVPINSDHASILLEADDAAHGNGLLRGWMLTALTFYTTDLPFYVLGVLLRGFSPALLREVPAVIYALTVMAAVALAGRGLVPERRWLGRLTAFVILGLPASVVPNIVLVGVNHIGTTLFMVLSLLALDRVGKVGPKRGALALFGTLLTLTVFGDSMASVVLIAPLIAVSLARLLQDRRCWNEEQKILIPILAAIPVSKLAQTLIRLAGGFQTAEPTMQVTFLRTLPENAGVTVRSLLSLFRANFFGRDIGLETLGMLLGLLALGFVLHTFWLGLKPWRGLTLGADRVTETLTAAMLVNLAAYLLDFDVVKDINVMYSPPERYLVPFFVFSAVLVGRFGTAQIGDLRRFRLGLAAVSVAYVSFFLQQLFAAPLTLPADRLTRWLQMRGLTDGYGNFWCSNIVTALSGGQIRVRAVTGDTHHIGRMAWFSKRQWYESRPAHFLVFDQAHSHGHHFYWGHVGPREAQNSFGPPDETDRVGPYTVLIWKKDIAPELTPSKAP